MISTARTWLARALVRMAILAAPRQQADQLEQVTRPIWRPE